MKTLQITLLLVMCAITIGCGPGSNNSQPVPSSRMKTVEDLGDVPSDIVYVKPNMYIVEIDGYKYIVLTADRRLAICPYQGNANEEAESKKVEAKSPQPQPQPQPQPMRQPEPSSNVFTEDDLDTIVPRRR